MDDIIQKIIDLMQSELGSNYKKYFYGENLVPEQAIFPFIEVIPTTTSIENRGTGGMKDNEMNIRINIKDSLKNFLSTNTDVSKVSHMQTMVKRMEERSSGDFRDKTIMGVLSNNLTLEGLVQKIGSWEISYEVLPLDGSYIIISSVEFRASLISPFNC
jgi:hypothetical protein